MERTKFDGLRNIMNEIEELEDFIPAFEKWYNQGLKATVPNTEIGMSAYRVCEFSVKRGSVLHETIVEALKNRLQTLKEEFENA